MADNDGGINSTAENKAGAAPAEANHRQSRPCSVNKAGSGVTTIAESGAELHDPEDPGSRDPAASSAASRDREDRVRQVRERQNSERARKLEELRAQALAAQRFREQKEEERRKRIDEMRTRDNDRRHQVEERKRAIWEAEKERREAILRRNEERDARMEVRRKSGAAGVFAFGSSTPRMLEPADTGGTFWGHRRATSTSNVMFAALPVLSRRSSERELDPNKKRATSASGLDRQPGDDFRVSSSMYEVFHWGEFGASDAGNARNIYPQQYGNHEEGQGDGAPWSRVARRRTDLVPTIPAPRTDVRTPRSPGRAYSMTRLDQLAQPRRPPALTTSSSPGGGKEGKESPVRPPRHRSSGQLSRVPGHRSVGNLTALHGPAPPPRKHNKPSPASGLKSGEITPSSPSRPGSSLSSASTAASVSAAMTSSVTGALVNRRPRAAPRRPRPASIAGTGVTTPPHVRNNAVGADGKPIGVRAEKPPLPRVHSVGTPSKKANQPPTPTSDKPEVPKRAHKGGSIKASPRLTPRTTPLQSPATDLPPSSLEEVHEPGSLELFEEIKIDTNIISQAQVIENSNILTESANATVTTITETVKQVTKEENGEKQTEVQTTIITSVSNNGDVQETKAVTGSEEKDKSAVSNRENSNNVVQESIVEGINNLKIKEETQEATSKVESSKQEANQLADPLEGVDMTASMSARSRGMITTEVEAKAALAERRRLAREEAERQAERERLRLEKEEEEEAERQRQEEERQRKLEEETIRLVEMQRRAEEERLQQAILETQRRTEEENQRREQEAKAKAEREVADARAREEAERLRKETAERLRREEEEREARRKRVEAIMLRTRQAKQKKDGDKSPTEENKSLEEDQKSIENKIVNEQQQPSEKSQQIESESAYEISVREREVALLNHSAPHNLTGSAPTSQVLPTRQETETNGVNPFQNGTTKPSNGDATSAKDRLLVETENSQLNNYAVQNGHSNKSQINELNNFINNSDNQYNNVPLDNTVIQNNVTNNLLDISDVDLLNTTNKNNPFLLDINTNGSSPMQPIHSQQMDDNNITQLLDFSVETMSKNLVNEDSMNSNQSPNSPFITSFQDNQENRDLSLL